jgi:hypothetical protein
MWKHTCMKLLTLSTVLLANASPHAAVLVNTFPTQRRQQKSPSTITSLHAVTVSSSLLIGGFLIKGPCDQLPGKACCHTLLPQTHINVRMSAWLHGMTHINAGMAEWLQ